MEALRSDHERDGCLSQEIKTACQDLVLFCDAAGTLTEPSLFHEDRKKAGSTDSLDSTGLAVTPPDLT
jgi:hypothetical protein